MSLRLNAPTADYFTPELSDRVDRFNATAGQWSARQEQHARRLATIMPIEARNITMNNGRPRDDGQPSWIGANTFKDGAAVIQAADAMRRERADLLTQGLALLVELESIRDAAQLDFATCKQRLAEAVTTAEDRARKESAKWSPAAQAAHVASESASVRQALQNAVNPFSERWDGWRADAIEGHRQELLRTLRAAFAAEVK